MPRYKPLKGFPGLKKLDALVNADAANKRVKKALDDLAKKRKQSKP